LNKRAFNERLRQWGRSIRTYVKSRSTGQLLLIIGGIPLALVALLFLYLFIGVMSGAYGPLPGPQELAAIENDDASSIYTEDGKLLGRYYAVNRVSVPADRISPYVPQALIATEDARFFDHGGIDVRALFRVAIRTILMGDRSAGGGSTISQQLAKQLYPRQEYGSLGVLKMKLREMVIASRLEDVYSKQELLNLYLNTVPFGEEAYGIQVAANRFFGKSAAELNLQESAVLIGLLKANTSYSPRLYPDKSRGRRNVVLNLMAKNGSLSEAVADSVAQLPLELNYTRDNNRFGTAAHFRQRLRGDVERALDGLQHPDGRPYDMDRDGLRIYVSIDSRLQRLAEEAVAEQLPALQRSLAEDWSGRREAPWEAAFARVVDNSPPYLRLAAAGKSREDILKALRTPRAMTIYDGYTGAPKDTLMRPIDSLRHYFTLLNAGLLATEPATGVVRAWVGGADYQFVQYDHVNSRRQVGSTIKPVVYATALRQGIQPCDYIPASQLTYTDYSDYSPGNANGQYDGAYSMRGGLSKSVNTVAVQLAVRSGLPTLAGQINAMGVEKEVTPLPSIALGTVEASLVEMNRVYATFANRGRRPPAVHYLDRVEDEHGNVLVAYARPTGGERVLDQQTADITTYLLAGVVNGGTGVRLRSTYGLKGALAGKTGTTQNQSDGWFLGFTPKLVVGTWVGAEYPAVHFRSLRRGSATATALPIWGTFMRKVQGGRGLDDYRGGSFPRLDSTVLELLDCPDYLEELPIVYDEDEFAPDREITRRLREFTREEIVKMVEDKRRRNNESAREYADRIASELEREDRRDERREERKQSWIKRLFGKKDGRGKN
jgi:penicillin-binding protein 1A